MKGNAFIKSALLFVGVLSFIIMVMEMMNDKNPPIAISIIGSASLIAAGISTLKN